MSKDKKLQVMVHLKDQSQPLIYPDVINTYQKGAFYCVFCQGEKVYKHPLGDIWRVIEDYGFHGRATPPEGEGDAVAQFIDQSTRAAFKKDILLPDFANIARNLRTAGYKNGYFECSDRNQGYHYQLFDDGWYEFRDRNFTLVSTVKPKERK